MLRPRWRKVLADLWENKARTLLAIASIAVGIFAVGMIAGAAVIIQQSMNTSYAGADPANIQISTDPFDEELLQSLRRLEGVAAAEGQRTVTVRMRTGPDSWNQLDLIARSDVALPQLELLAPAAGASSPADREVLLVCKTSERYGFAPGQTLQIELADGTRKSLPVAGVVRDLTTGKRGFLAKGLGYITRDTLEWLHQPQSYNRIYVTVAEQPNSRPHIEAVAAQITDYVERSGRTVYGTDVYLRSQHPLGNIVTAILGVLAVLGVLLVFLSGSLIANTLSALLAQHLRQIGVMKLIGARRGQIAGMYLALILSLGLMALAIAVPPAGWGAYWISAIVADLINFELPPAPHVPLVPQAVLVQAAMAVLMPLLAGALPVLNGSRITVQQAITGTGSAAVQPRGGLLDRLLARPRWISRPLLISIRNTFRRKGRLVLTLFTLTLGGAVFIAVFNVRVALDHTVERTTHYFQADVNLDLNRLYPIETIETLVRTVPGVEGVEAWAAAVGEVIRPDDTSAGQVTILAPPAGSELVEPVLLAGRWLLPGDENAITVNEAFRSRLPGLQPGSRLRIQIAGEEQEWAVVGVFQFTGADELYAYANFDYVARRLHQPQQSAMFRVVTRDHSRSEQERVSAQLDALLRNQGIRVGHVETGGETAQTITDYLWILIVVLVVMALLTALVGSIGLSGTLSMNVLERTREIGIMRAVGAHDAIVIRLVVAEGLLIGLISYVLAIVASFPISALLSNVVTQAIFGTSSSQAFTLQGFALWLAAVVAFSVTASVIPARSACALTIREVLAYE